MMDEKGYYGLNGDIFNQILKSFLYVFRQRRDMMGPAATAAHQQQLNEDHRQALVLFSIVIIFLVTNTPRILINIDEVKKLFIRRINHATIIRG